MAKRFEAEYEADGAGKKKMVSIMLNVAIVLCLLISLCFGLSYVKEGLVAAAAETKVENVRGKVIEDGTHGVDFAAAKKLGCNASSWLYIPDTGIDYPLVQSADNDFFVEHDCYGEDSQAGAIFIHYANNKDLSDGKSVIFGHNMLDGSMFANLKNYSDREFGQRHPDAYVFLDNGKVRHYRVRYYIHTDPYNDNIYVTSKSEDPSVTAKLLKADAGVVYEEYTGGRLICLSTCSHHTERTVVVFEEVDDSYPLISKNSGYYKENAVSCVLDEGEQVSDEESVSYADTDDVAEDAADEEVMTDM